MRSCLLLAAAVSLVTLSSCGRSDVPSASRQLSQGSTQHAASPSDHANPSPRPSQGSTQHAASLDDQANPDPPHGQGSTQHAAAPSDHANPRPHHSQGSHQHSTSPSDHTNPSPRHSQGSHQHAAAGGHENPGLPHHGQSDNPHEQTTRLVNPGQKVEIGHTAPDFSLVDLDGKSWQLSQLHRKADLEHAGVVVLTFWCSFCGSCRDVERDLDALSREYSGRVAVFGLDASAGETPEAVSTFLEAQGLTMPVLLDAERTTPDIFGTELTTTTVVLDADGVLRYCGQFANGPHSYARDAVEDLLAGRQVRLNSTPFRG